jgi:hypothetical protein
MWLDRRKRRSITFKVDDIEFQMIKDIAEALEVPLGEAVRRALWAFCILYDENLKVRDALKESFDVDAPLAHALKPVPELAHILGIELKIWKRQAAMN